MITVINKHIKYKDNCLWANNTVYQTLIVLKTNDVIAPVL